MTTMPMTPKFHMQNAQETQSRARLWTTQMSLDGEGVGLVQTDQTAAGGGAVGGRGMGCAHSQEVEGGKEEEEEHRHHQQPGVDNLWQGHMTLT